MQRRERESQIRTCSGGRRDGINTVDERGEENERQPVGPHHEEKVEEVTEDVEHSATGFYVETDGASDLNGADMHRW